MRSWFRHACLLGALLPVLALSPARAQVDSREGIALQNQMYQLRQDLQSLGAAVARMANNGGGGGGGGGDVGQLLSRVQAMEEALRQLNGRIDETQNQNNRQYADLSKRLDDLTFQLNFQAKSGGNPAPPPPVREVAPRPAPPPEPRAEPRPEPRVDTTPRPALPTVNPAPQSFTFNQVPEPMREVRQPPPPPTAHIDPVRPVPKPAPPQPPQAPDESAQAPTPATPVSISPDGKRTPELALQEGHAALARRDYVTAERSAREVMTNRASPRAYDGQFLLAETLSGEKQFAQAAIAYDDTYNRSHKGRHAQDALVGLAGALTAINEKKAACDTLGRLRTEFPQVRVDLKDAITKANDRAGCGHG